MTNVSNTTENATVGMEAVNAAMPAASELDRMDEAAGGEPVIDSITRIEAKAAEAARAAPRPRWSEEHFDAEKWDSEVDWRRAKADLIQVAVDDWHSGDEDEDLSGLWETAEQHYERHAKRQAVVRRVVLARDLREDGVAPDLAEVVIDAVSAAEEETWREAGEMVNQAVTMGQIHDEAALQNMAGGAYIDQITALGDLTDAVIAADSGRQTKAKAALRRALESLRVAEMAMVARKTGSEIRAGKQGAGFHNFVGY